jgi:hypothetical protein
MDVTVKVDVATARPPKDHATMYAIVSVDVPDTGNLMSDLWTAETEAREIAYHMAFCHPHVVMVTRTKVIDVTNI